MSKLECNVRNYGIENSVTSSLRRLWSAIVALISINRSSSTLVTSYTPES